MQNYTLLHLVISFAWKEKWLQITAFMDSSCDKGLQWLVPGLEGAKFLKYETENSGEEACD